MKTFEENFTAWIDGQLTGQELVDFEASLPDRAAAEAEKHEALKLGALLKEELSSHAMTNEEFFHHQLLEEIKRDAASQLPESRPRETWWTIGRLVWTGAASLAVFMVCTFFILRPPNPGGESTYLTQIKSARVDPSVSPNADISIFEQKQDRVTVIWINGLESLPSEFAAK